MRGREITIDNDRLSASTHSSDRRSQPSRPQRWAGAERIQNAVAALGLKDITAFQGEFSRKPADLLECSKCVRSSHYESFGLVAIELNPDW
ncbi:MAG: glycosyltransferase family 1 protein [Chloroflexaceae bacterium]|nr:glycosyltransferase family 1 protein [Chloroflexaceae bacterium]